MTGAPNLSPEPVPAHAGQVAVVGGGVLGMYLAYLLRRDGRNVTLIESGPRLGGLASPETIGGYTWDRFYHVILMSDLNTRKLLEILGLQDKLRWGTTKTGFYVDGELYSMSTAIEFLRFPPLNIIDKLRLGATIFYASRIRNWRKLESVTAIDWLTKLSGERVAQRIWLPLLKSKLGPNATRASAAFIWATIARMYAARRTGIKTEMFGYVEGGYDSILRAFQQLVTDMGVDVRYNAKVDNVTNHDDKVVVTWNGGENESFESAVLTVPTPTVSQLCSQLSQQEADRLNSVTYQGIVCASMLLKKPISHYYVTNITDGWVPFTGIIEMTALVDKENFGGNSLVYLPCYLAQDDKFWHKPDDEVEELFIQSLERMYDHFDRRDVIDFKISRARKVLAVSTLNYSELQRPALETSCQRIFTINSAQIANGTLNVNETIGIAEQMYAELEKRIDRPLAA